MWIKRWEGDDHDEYLKSENSRSFYYGTDRVSSHSNSHRTDIFNRSSGRGAVKMWQLCVLSGLVLASACHAVPREARDPNAIYFPDQDWPLIPKEPVIPKVWTDSPSSGSDEKCGQRNSNGLDESRKANEGEAEFGEFPWVVAILNLVQLDPKLDLRNMIYNCAGSLIRPQVVLTGAHCVYKYKNKLNELMIRAGEWDILSTSEKYRHQDRYVAKIITHENFHNRNLRNDFAILILAEPFELAPNVGLVCLPRENDGFVGSRCFSNGWGKDNFETGRYQLRPKKVEVPVVGHNQCQNFLRKTRLGYRFILDQSFICAGGEDGVDMCKGDGGAPLACPDPRDPSRYVQVGIVAWGIGCGGKEIPGVYANVAAGRRWIDKAIEENI